MRRYWNPWQEMEALRREIDRVFEGYGWEGERPARAAFLPGRSARGYPLVNVYEDPEETIVEALAPGVDPKSLEVSVKGSTLTIAGEKKPPADVPAEAYHRSERSAAKFVRTVQLGGEVNEAKVKADYDRGILKVRLPKAEHAKPKQISVDVK